MCRSRIGKKPTDDLGVPGEDPPVGAKNETIGGGVSETPPGRHVPRPGRRRKKNRQPERIGGKYRRTCGGDWRRRTTKMTRNTSGCGAHARRRDYAYKIITIRTYLFVKAIGKREWKFPIGNRKKTDRTEHAEIRRCRRFDVCRLVASPRYRALI